MDAFRHSESLLPGSLSTILHFLESRPALLRAYLDLHSVLDSELPVKLRTLAAIRAAQVDDSPPALQVLLSLSREVGLTDAQIENLEFYEESGAFDDTERAVMQFAEQWIRQPSVNGNVVEEIKKHLTSGQILALVSSLGLSMTFHRFCATFGQSDRIDLPT